MSTQNELGLQQRLARRIRTRKTNRLRNRQKRFRRALIEVLEERVMLSATARWIGGSGSWPDPGNWDIGAVPSNTGNTTYSVSIDSPNSDLTISVDQTVTIDALTNAETLHVASGATSILDRLDNTGLARSPVLRPAYPFRARWPTLAT